MLRSVLARPHHALAEIGALAALYALYETVRGTGGSSLGTARRHTDDIVGLERVLHVFHEHALQSAVAAVPVLPLVLGLAYMLLHFAGTAVAMRWIYRNRRDAFPLVRTALVVSTAIALVGYVLYPAAPPRLAGLGFDDTVSSNAHVNLSSDALGALYNPYAAVPSLHFGYALLVGGAIAFLARRRWIRVVGVLYPAFMLFDIVATGNHFLFDAAAGALVVTAGVFVARHLAAERTPRCALHPVIA